MSTSRTCQVLSSRRHGPRRHLAKPATVGGCGAMFEAIIVSPQFAKKTTLSRHRLVNGALKQEIAAIHAWTPKCYTPEEWERKRAEEGVCMPQGV